MSVHRAHKQSDLEKRLRLLNTQLYGKPASQRISKSENQQVKDIESRRYSDTQILRPTEVSHRAADTTFLRRDLTKIAILSGLAVGAQVLIYYALSIQLLKLPF